MLPPEQAAEQATAAKHARGTQDRNRKGEPKVNDFRIEEEELPALQDGQILLEAEYLSIDPYQRAFTQSHKVGATMIGVQVAQVVESRSPKYPVGSHVVRNWGWRDRTVADDVPTGQPPIPPMLLPDLGGLPISLSLGVLGVLGGTAYFGLLEICDPKPGKVVVVSGAAGAVGSLVGQIARIKGCKVIGFGSSDLKVKMLKEELGFNHAFNYKTVNVDKALKEAAPQGVDVYFDNVGGELSSEVIKNMKERGPISVCSSVSTYNATSEPMAPVIQKDMVELELKMEGFKTSRWLDQLDKSSKEIAQWIQQGKLKYKETVTEGFENTPQAFIGMLRGENVGKAVVKV